MDPDQMCTFSVVLTLPFVLSARPSAQPLGRPLPLGRLVRNNLLLGWPLPPAELATAAPRLVRNNLCGRVKNALL